MSSCRFKYIDDKFQSTNSKLADELTDTAINIWGKLKASNLFSIKDSKMFFNKEKTKKRVKQDELVSSINTEYKQEVVKNIDNNVNVNVLPLAGDNNSIFPLYKEYTIKNNNIKPGVEELFDSNPKLANSVYSKILTNSGLSAENLLSLLLKDNLIEKQCP